MIEPRVVKNWLYRGGFALVFLTVLFFSILPLEVGSGSWPGPDLVLAFAFAWVLRRPSYVPLFWVGCLFLIGDFVYMRPPGLWAGLSVLALEFLRDREGTSRDMPFLVEWATVGVVMLGLAVLYRLTLGIFMVDQTSLGLVILQQISTFCAYPFVLLISVNLMGVTKISTAEAELIGQTR
jgi:rod shape-determining protein MreD